MSQTQSEQQFATPQEALAHFGVKGMKWGVRKSESGGGSGGGGGERGKIRRGLTKANVATDAGAKIIREGEKKLIFLPNKNRADAASRTQTRMLGAARRVNKDPEFKGKDIKNNPELKSKYFEKLKEEAKTIYAEELNISRTEAWGEFLSVDTSATTQQMRINAAVDKIRHADGDADKETLLELNFVTDDLGHVTDIKVPNKYLKHEMFEDNEHTLMHYGVKGMKWGVRNDNPTNDDIHDARSKLYSKNRAYQKERKAIKRGERPLTRAEKKVALSDLKTSALADPDRKTAMTMTKGEKAVLAVMVVGMPPAGLTLVAQRAWVNSQLNKAQREAQPRHVVR